MHDGRGTIGFDVPTIDRQYLLVTASAVQPSTPGAIATPHAGPSGLVADGLPR